MGRKWLVALCLAWAPAPIRARVAGTLAGVAGVATAVAFGYFTFQLFLGPGSFSIGAFLASTLPLVVPILNDHKRARQLAAVEEELPEAVRVEVTPTTDAARYSVVGYLLGLALAVIWFFIRQDNAA